MRVRVRFVFAAVALVALAGAALVAMQRADDVPRSALIGKPAPSIPLERSDGFGSAPVAVSGMVTVINFWAPWCVPCRGEHRDFGELRAEWDPDTVRLVGVVFQSSPDEVARFLSEVGDNVPTFADNDGIAAIEFGVVGVPETFVIDQQGIVRHRIVGPIDKDELAELVAKLVSAA
jgi:cytochrome c biogenesis protein CcmG, thiol:disulfide interchange protein DsbE